MLCNVAVKDDMKTDAKDNAKGDVKVDAVTCATRPSCAQTVPGV
jgi:hypothetical protein